MVLLAFSHHQFPQVQQTFEVVVDVLGQNVEAVPHFHFHYLEYQVLGGRGQVFPHHAPLFTHQAVYRFGDHRCGGVQEIGFDLVHVDGLDHCREAADTANSGIYHAGGEFADTGGHNPSPAEGKLPHVLQRVESHLDGEPVGAPAPPRLR